MHSPWRTVAECVLLGQAWVGLLADDEGDRHESQNQTEELHVACSGNERGRQSHTGGSSVGGSRGGRVPPQHKGREVGDVNHLASSQSSHFISQDERYKYKSQYFNG